MMDGDDDVRRFELANKSVEGGGGTVNRFEMRFASVFACDIGFACMYDDPFIEGAVGGRKRTNLLDCCDFVCCC